MTLRPLFEALADALDGDQEIERHARVALRDTAPYAAYKGPHVPLAAPFLDVMARADAHPVCRLIATARFNWVPPQTSTDPEYIAVSRTKAHVELVGPGGIVVSDSIRLGLYGMLPNAEYGLRTHPAEEIYVMLAGDVYWQRHPAPYQLQGPGSRSYHPSMMPHGNKTGASAFMSVYVWHGDISTENYVYSG